MQDRSKSDGVLASFRQLHKQIQQPEKKSEKEPRTSDNYNRFLVKYRDLDTHMDYFNCQELMYYFRERANCAGIKYVISNMHRDMGMFKRLLTRYSAREICMMIEFIFFSNQNYLVREETQPTVLLSSWCNTIYRDAKLWVDDKYIPRKTVTKVSREWKSTGEEKIKIGEWE